jgi:hypothetical protein
MSRPPLPPGFVLDNKNTPRLPAGFVMDAPAPSPRSNLRRVDILPPAANEVPSWAKSLPEFAQPMFEQGEQRALDEWRQRVAYEMRPGAGNVELTQAPTEDDVDRLALRRWESAGRKAPPKDIGQMTAGLAGLADLATFGASDEVRGVMMGAEKLAQTGSLRQAGQAFTEGRDDMQALLSDSVEQRPFSTRAGQTVALAPAGGRIFTNTAAAAAKIVPARVAAAFAGQEMSKRGVRYAGRLAALVPGGVLDYYLYNFAAEAPNQARLQGGQMPGMTERAQFAAEDIFTPAGAIAAASGPAASLIGRGANYVGTTVGRTAQATAEANRGGVASAGLPRFEWRGGTFTPADVRAQAGVGDYDANVMNNRTVRDRVIDKILDEGFEPDTAERVVRLLSYDNYSNVSEMLFELDAGLKSLATAVGRSKTVGEDVLREAFKGRREAMNDEIRNALRNAVGASGDNLKMFATRMEEAAVEATADGYAKAHARQVSDNTWQNIMALLLESGPGAIKVVNNAAAMLRGSAKRRPEYLAAAQDMEDLASSLKNNTPGPNRKTSTLALDYLDRAIQGEIGITSRAGNKPFAASWLDMRNALRQSGLDADTGLNVPRTQYAQYMLAQEALEYGEKAFGKSRSLRDMKREFEAGKRRADDALEEGIGEGSSVIDQALMMGWVRGAENAIEMADNPATLIRQLYGSERQRAKLLSMLQELPDDAPAGFKADTTKRKKALVGSKGVSQDYRFDFSLSTGERVRGRAPVRSLFDRQRDMLESERITVGGSPTAGAAEALAHHGGRQRWQNAMRMLMGVVNAPGMAVARVLDSMAEPLIFQREASRELGNILSTRGRDELLDVIAEIRARQALRAGEAPPPPAPPIQQGPRPPTSGGVAAGGFGAGLRTDLGNAAAGALGGGITPIPSTGDPQEDLRNRMAAILGGAGLGSAGRRLAGAFGGRADDIAEGGFGGRIRIRGMSNDDKNRHGLMPHLRMQAKNELPEKIRDKLAQETNPANVDKQLLYLDSILQKHPNPLRSPNAWAAMMADALGSNDVPVAPYALIRDLKDGTAAKTIRSLTPGQIADADHGFRNARQMKELYTAGATTPSDTGALFAWGFLSRGVSPYTQEGMFIDAFNGIGKWIDDAASGRFNEAAYLRWAETVSPKGSGQPGSGASHNLNAFGTHFLKKMSMPVRPGANQTKLEYLHQMMADPDMTGQQIRREFARIGSGVGIDNKVVSFALLVSGRDDVMVLDRVQMRKLWNDGRFDNLNLYDGFKQDSKTVTGSALSSITYGVRGLLIYEAIERELQKRLRDIYAGSGRENQASIGRYHWETWVAQSQQEASHGTLDAITRRIQGDPRPMAGVTAKEGEYGAYSYGARYGIEDGERFIEYPVPGGGTYRMSPSEFGQFREAIKKPGNGVVPSRFKVSDAGDQPWYYQDSIDLGRLDAVASQFGRRIGGGGIQEIDAGAVGAKDSALQRSFNQPQGASQAGPQRRGSGASQKAGPADKSRGLNDVARDAGIAGIALGASGSAQAETQDYTREIEAASRRIETASARVLEIERTAIPRLEDDLRVLEDPNSDPKQVQRLLANRGFDLGPRGVDGVIGPATQRAIADNIREIKSEIGFQRGELERARAEETAARDGLTQAEMRAAQAQAAGQGPNAISKFAPWLGAAIGIAAASGLRYSAVRNSAVKARAAAQEAEALINTRPVNRRTENHPDSITARAPRLNKFWQQGGAGDNVPLRTITSGPSRGQWRDRPGALEPSQLFTANPPRYTAMDASIAAGGLGEAGLSHMAAMSAQRDVEAAKAEVERYAAAGDVAGMQRALSAQKSAENRLVAFEFARSAGLGLAGGRIIAGMKMNYVPVRPDVSRAEQERSLLLTAIEKSR